MNDCRDVVKDISEKPERATHPPSVEKVLRIILSKEYHFFFCDHNYQMRVILMKISRNLNMILMHNSKCSLLQQHLRHLWYRCSSTLDILCQE